MAQFVFIKGNEVPNITYDKRKGKYMKQKGVTLPKFNFNAKIINRWEKNLIW